MTHSSSYTEYGESSKMLNQRKRFSRGTLMEFVCGGVATKSNLFRFLKIEKTSLNQRSQSIHLTQYLTI
ncbi:hypothetical protein EAW56_10345 [Corynebacterium gottingense]|uniref:Uncharacterized protein n=1 Tax=Corynebacterium gottingense TaxID=2041036 RepID=A0ABX9UHD8_9CORY|nr:hypothetical protein EAW56_10345 [Corynebacterium gottingense]